MLEGASHDWLRHALLCFVLDLAECENHGESGVSSMIAGGGMLRDLSTLREEDSARSSTLGTTSTATTIASDAVASMIASSSSSQLVADTEEGV